MEKTLLDRTPDPAEALQAAELADAAAADLPPAGQVTWQLLLAGCLDKGGRRDDARLRLQRVLRDGVGSPQVLAGLILQARWLADADSYPAAVALVSEYLQALSAVDKQPTQGAASHGVASCSEGEQPQNVTRGSLWLLKASLQTAWSDKLSRSAGDLDRQAAEPLRQQASRAAAKARAAGGGLLRLLPMLQGLDASAD